MILSKSCEYAIRASVFVASKSQKKQRVGINEVSEAIGSPRAFTAKILQTLVRKNILSSAKGPAGGFYLERSDSLHLIDIIRATDGNGLFISCVLGLRACSDTQPCPMHKQVKPIRDQLLIEFSNKPITDFVTDLERGKYYLK
ncbi:MAG TPA: Rrf2 family transcriptional regulator [Mucilaginibacter sp.]|nr:Rrf2 family transcriptional regulator [Mucilaginibacter sp.]